MVFSSVEFLFVYLPLFLLAQNFLPRRNLVYALFSLLFYFMGEGWYTGFVILSVALNYAFGLMIDGAVTPRGRKQALILSLVVNLALLFFFKYFAFFVRDVLGVEGGGWVEHIHLPLGISFFTFHSISYLIDIYRRDAKAERSFVNLSLYILMFPQLIAGPILRFHTVANQLKRRVVRARHVYYGVLLFCFGLGQKVLIADTLAGVADPLFSRAAGLSSLEAWIAALSYTLQIFFDFSGYSNMAIGLGWLTGFYFPKNFNYPYISKSITEFWRRWHMSLSRWFRDYLYISLGGNRAGAFKTYRNLLVVFLLCGLWHGAAWTFIAWGAYHGALLVIERIGLGRALERLPAPLQHAYALLAVVLGWVLFRADSMSQAVSIVARMFGAGGHAATSLAGVMAPEQMLAFALGVLFSSPIFVVWINRYVPLPIVGQWQRGTSVKARAVGCVLGGLVFGLAAAKIITGSYSPFIYFRF